MESLQNQILAKGFLKLLNLLILMKQESLFPPINLTYVTFDEWLILFLTELNLLYFLYSTALRCYFSLGSSSKCSQLKSFLYILL